MIWSLSMADRENPAMQNTNRVIAMEGTVVSVSEIGSEAEIKAVITNQDGKRVTRGIIKAGLAK